MDSEFRRPFYNGEKVADGMGDHHVGCGRMGTIFIRNTLFSSAQSAALTPTKGSSVPDFWLYSSSPADIFPANWCRGHPASLDVTVFSTLQSVTRSGEANTQGFAMGVGELREIAAHNEACQAEGVHVFHPIGERVFGSWLE